MAEGLSCPDAEDSMPLHAILAERETRWNLRRSLAARYGQAVLSLTLNIPGENKNPDGAAEAFARLHDFLYRTVRRQAGESTFIGAILRRGADGSCWISPVALDPLRLKAICVTVEEEHFLGRLADADVLDAQGQPVTRAHLGLPPRSCFLCDAPAALCRREGRHAPEQVAAYVRDLLNRAAHATHEEHLHA